MSLVQQVWGKGFQDLVQRVGHLSANLRLDKQGAIGHTSKGTRSLVLHTEFHAQFSETEGPESKNGHVGCGARWDFSTDMGKRGWLVLVKSGEDSEIMASQKALANWPGYCIREGVEVWEPNGKIASELSVSRMQIAKCP